ncbi:hypothetical protein ACHAWT_005014 [Skeletonema menzelii]
MDVKALGWPAFSQFFCDISSVNNTHLFNHTLEAIGCRKLKVLPFVLTWFERAQSCRVYLEESITSFERRELSALYQFIHGLPLLVTNGFYKQMRTEKKRKIDQCDK